MSGEPRGQGLAPAGVGAGGGMVARAAGRREEETRTEEPALRGPSSQRRDPDRGRVGRRKPFGNEGGLPGGRSERPSVGLKKGVGTAVHKIGNSKDLLCGTGGSVCCRGL